MILSRILMVFALAVLAYLVWFTMHRSDKQSVKKVEIPEAKIPEAETPEKFTQNKGINSNKQPKINYERFQEQAPAQEQTPAQAPEPVPAPAPAPQQANIRYEKTGGISGISDGVHGAAPFGSNQPVEEGDMATVKYTGLVDGTPGDIIQIEGTDLLTAPLVDNMLYTNSIANTNRNASNDLRGDIPLQFNDTYTPFYSSVIYGAPLSQKQMTIGNL